MKMKTNKLLSLRGTLTRCMAVIGLCIGCQSEVEIPSTYESSVLQATLFPDYKEVVVPPNIAPLNFMLKDPQATACVVCLKGEKDSLRVGGRKGKIKIDIEAWHTLLQQNRGKEIEINVYAKHQEGWVKYRPHTIRVAQEEIDRYLSYRLIEPGYELYRQLGIYQRDLTGWEVHTVYENNRSFSKEHSHCINCHNYQNYSAKHGLFHVRANHGGTIIFDGQQARKVQIKDQAILSASVYPAWHPTLPLIAFSTNRTQQAFHIHHKEKVEVFDEASDLLLYDVERNEVRHILHTTDQMETFPHWSPDGKTLYYCVCDTKALLSEKEVSDDRRWLELMSRYDQVRYNLMRISFDPQSKCFGEPELVLDAASMGKSVSVPRVSPDGRYVLCTLGDYGQFHIWHKSSDLYVVDLQEGSCQALTAANSTDAESYHAWSSNGRWMVFSSRRDDGNYTRPYIAYFDEKGRAYKAFMLPHEDPEESLPLLKSYNVPELTRDRVEASSNTLRSIIYESDGEKAKYIE